MVTARLGIVLDPALRTEITSCVCSDNRCDVGKLADVTCTGNFPLGSVASSRAPLPHPASPTTAARAAKKLLPAPLLMARPNIPPGLLSGPRFPPAPALS